MMPMCYLLNIDTATEHASVCISHGPTTLAMDVSTDQQKHAAFLQPAIQKLCSETGISLSDISAVAVTSGPGSYTGLRVGMASAKGICFALQIPLITINTLQVMALAAREEQGHPMGQYRYCPMIDARRMEVFTAVFDTELHLVEPPHPLILEEGVFSSLMEDNTLIFSGSGAAKMQPFTEGKKAVFSRAQHQANHLAQLAAQAWEAKDFADLAYAEPQYFKAFHSTQKSTG